MLTIISKEKINGLHQIESQSGRTSVWLEGYVEVPEHLIDLAWETCGYCDLVFDEDKNFIGIIPTEKPVIEEPILKPNTEERIAALEAENAALAQQLTDTQMALCDVYEALILVTTIKEGE